VYKNRQLDVACYTGSIFRYDAVKRSAAADCFTAFELYLGTTGIMTMVTAVCLVRLDNKKHFKRAQIVHRVLL
jgi:hypothetical protein